jgi:hypothetical protein
MSWCAALFEEESGMVDSGLRRSAAAAYIRARLRTMSFGRAKS